MVACSAWLGPDESADQDWWRLLGESVAREPDGHRLVIDDSKRVWPRSDGRRLLSETARAALNAVGCEPGDLDRLLRSLSSGDSDGASAEHWYAALEFACRDGPRYAESFLGRRVSNESQHCSFPPAGDDRAEPVKPALHLVLARTLFPTGFNRRLAVLQNKAAIEIELVVALLRAVLDRGECCQRVHVTVDRLGGRRHYRRLVEEVAGDAFVRTIVERAARSEYRFSHNDRDVAIVFRVEADRVSMPVALASMIAKYVRERCMEAFNAYWTAQVRGLAPTAGYPRDAVRFLEAVRPHLAEAGISLNQIWRER